MENVNNLLDKLIGKLKEEKDLLIKSIQDARYVEELVKVIEEKRDILSQLSKYNREDFKGFEDKLREIETLGRSNLTLAANNAQFIDEIFSVLFEEPQKYDQSGNISQEQKGLFNKKI
ncbi:MAG TPA: hypothetical protein DEP48_05780 [Persephonella sp.]|uniref:FlgN protein n=1 Tax=Persephonella marina (strain DSM 14350 / EX-H1) TaxID=123214 RepID=C0QPD8_PERMH|nr:MULTISPECIES: hypothetical protein [Persephonella]ACO04627.1 conserved hypothetical protein [Persephonella marina EX-H1]HCB69851.1 hypothetical protein [Persephonella sp.]